MRKLLLACLALPVSVTLSALSVENDRDSRVVWPGWRGPGRDGWVRHFEPPRAWPQQLEHVWKASVGAGYASPVVGDGRVYQHARQGDQEVVWCLELKTGQVHWRQSYAAPFTMGGGGERHGKGPKSSPALDENRLFTLSITGLLSAWDAQSGKLLWRRDYAGRFQKGHPYWGAATSPLVVGNRVIVHFGTDDQGALMALDVATGDVVWSHGADGAAYASPITLEIGQKKQIVELNMRALVAVDSETGQKLWEYPYPQVGSDQNMVTPAFHRETGLLLLGGENRGIRALQTMFEGGEWTVKERWHQEDVALDMSSAVLNGDLLYGFSHYDRGRLFCLDVATGAIRWLGSGRTGENVAFLALPDHVVALVNDGELRVIAASGEKLQVVASYRVSDSPTWAPPVLLSDGLLVKDSETLTRWSLGAP